jgi:hypothetical protein
MATLDRFPYSSAPVKRVKAIQFGILDPDFVVSKAATKRKKAAIGAFLSRRVRTVLAVAVFFPCRSALLCAALVVALCFDCSESLVQPLAIDELLDARKESPVLSSTRGLTSAFIW